MKVSYRQLQAIVKLMVTASLVDQPEDQESEKMLRFLQEFKLDNDKIRELIISVEQIELTEAISIIHQLDQPTQQEISNRLFGLIMADGSMSEQECNFFTGLIKHFELPLPDTQEWEEWISTISGETDEEEVFSNEEKYEVTPINENEALCFYVIEPCNNDATFIGKCCVYIRLNNTVTPKEVIARELLKCRKSTLLEWKNLPVLNAVTEDMGYTSYGDYRAYIAKHPSDQSENKAASKLLGKKVYGPCLIQFVSKEGKFQYMRKKLCPTFYKYLQRRLGCYMTFFHKYINL